VLDQGNGFIKDAIKRIPTNQKNMFLQEFTEHRVKGSIHHELTHWIDDTLNNNHINRYITKYKNKFEKEYSSGNINANYVERQAQIHNIKQLYNSHKLIWDSLTFQEMLNLSPTLVFLFRRLSEDDKKQWTKDIKKRMFRENLLGKMMK
jgi:hypothetical protein